MIGQWRQMVVPAYLFACLLLGGSAQGPLGNLALQLVGLAIIAWSLVERPAEPLLKPARHLLWIAAAGIAVVALQLVPLPPSVWTRLGGRGVIAEGYDILGMPLPWRPASLAPYRTIDALLGAIPPLAVLLGIVRLKANRGVYAAMAVLAGTVAGICLSALQLSSAQAEQSPWYIYPVSNVGFGVGFFANANHMASLLLVAVPFLMAMVAAAQRSHVQRYTAFLAMAAGTAVLLLLGLGLNGSLAGFGLFLPVAGASLLIVLPPRRNLRRAVATLSVVMAIGGVSLLAVTDIGRARFGSQADVSVQSRAQMLGPTIDLGRQFAPLGSGVGTFRETYPLAEDPAAVSSIYVIHAHNDYAEWVMEGGLPAALLILLFLAWWVRASIAAWRNSDAAAFARAASIASAALLLHSMVDFPLRTSALASVFALCVALLADRRSPVAANAGDLRPTRHVVIR